jgi:hypothetical protein
MLMGIFAVRIYEIIFSIGVLAIVWPSWLVETHVPKSGHGAPCSEAHKKVQAAAWTFSSLENT